jgi:hypothetical protein
MRKIEARPQRGYWRPCSGDKRLNRLAKDVHRWPRGAGADGLYALEAGTGLLIAHGTWTGRCDFGRFINHSTGTAAIDWKPRSPHLMPGCRPDPPLTQARRAWPRSWQSASGTTAGNQRWSHAGDISDPWPLACLAQLMMIFEILNLLCRVYFNPLRRDAVVPMPLRKLIVLTKLNQCRGECDFPRISLGLLRSGSAFLFLQFGND